jgi:hypothetical protein
LLQPLRKALAKQKSADLIDALLDLARGDRKVLRILESRFGVEAPQDELIEATRQAIVDATDFDEREINRNFDYDYAAYQSVQRNFGRLIEMEALDDAMELSMELMRRASHQVEMSDEGMMTDDIESCLDVVIKALEKADLKPERIVSWCDQMTRADRVKFICEKQLKELRKRFEGIT